MIVCADQLRPGDVLLATGRTVERVVLDGLYMRGQDDKWLTPRIKWPVGKCEVVLSDGTLNYWNKRTAIGICRQSA